MCIIWSEVSDPCPRAQILLLHIWVLSCELQENWVTMLSTSDKVRNIDKFNHSYLIKGNTYPRVSQSNYYSIFWLFYTAYVPHFFIQLFVSTPLPELPQWETNRPMPAPPAQAVGLQGHSGTPLQLAATSGIRRSWSQQWQQHIALWPSGSLQLCWVR